MDRGRNYRESDGTERRGREYDDDSHVSWRSAVLRLGDPRVESKSQDKPEEHLNSCVTLLSRQLSDTLEPLAQLLVECGEQFPQKAPMYATLVSLLSLKEKRLKEEIISVLHQSLQSAVTAGDCNKIRLLLRFLSLLSVNHVVTSSSLLSTLREFVSSAIAMIASSGDFVLQPKADFYAYCVMSALPFFACHVSQEEEFGLLLTLLSDYMTKRTHFDHPGGQLFQPVYGSTVKAADTEPDQDFLEDLWARIQWLETQHWSCDSVPQSQEAFAEKIVSNERVHFPALAMAPPPLSVPPMGPTTAAKLRFETLQAYPPRFRRVHIFPAAKVDQQKMTVVDRFLVEEYIVDILRYMNGCRKECAVYLLVLPVPFRYDYVLAETIFSLIFLLPHTYARLVYYTIVMVDLCKALPAAFTNLVASAVTSLFDRIADMDMECRERLVQWFSHHLSNFGYIWKWDSWQHVVDLPRWHPQRLFVAMVLEREVRLSYWDKVKETLDSDEMAALLPPTPAPFSKYGAREVEGDDASWRTESALAFSAELRRQVGSKAAPAVIQSWIEGQLVAGELDRAAVVDVTVQTLLYMGAKSFTHTMAVLERYGAMLHKLAGTQDLQVALVTAVAEIWRSSPQMTAIVIDRCMGFRIVSNLSILDWVFSPACQETFHVSNLVWEVLGNMLNKTRNRTVDLRKQLAAAQKEVVRAEAAWEEAQDQVNAVLSRPVRNEESSRQLADAERRSSEAQEEVESAKDSLDAKQFLLNRILQEQETLLVSLLRNFVECLTVRLGEIEDSGGVMAVDGEDDVAQGSDSGAGDHTEERKAWVGATLSHLRSIFRNFAAETWLLMERVEREVLAEGMVHPLVVRTFVQGVGNGQAMAVV